MMGVRYCIIIKPGEYVTSQNVACKLMNNHGINFEVDIL